MDYSSHFELPKLRREHLQMQNESPRPRVILGCICRNGHMPDENGWVSVDPNRLRHGRRLPHSTRAPSPAEKEAIALREAARKADMLRKAKRARERAEKKQQMKR